MKHRLLLKKITWMIIFILGISWLSSAQRDSLTIDMALNIAEENNPSLKSSKLRLEQSQLTLIAQRASLKSSFSLSLEPVSYSNTRRFDNRLSQWYENETFNTGGSFRISQPILPTDGTLSLRNNFSWQDNSSLVDGVPNQNKSFTNNLFLSFDQPIFTYNTQKMALKRLEIEYENYGISYALQRLNTEVSISRQFYSVYMAQENLIIVKEELENAKQNYEIIKSKVDADLSAKEELYQAEVNYASAQSSVENQIAGLEDAKDDLKQILGMPMSEDIRVKADIVINTVLISLDKAVNNGMDTRMELRQRELDMELGEMAMVQTKALNEFKGNISLSLGIQGVNENFGNMYDKPTQSPSIGISFQIPLFDWGEKKARIKAQQTAQTITKLNYENQKITIEIDIRQLVRQIENYRNQIDIAEKNVRNAQLTFDLNQTRYRMGELSGMQISQYQTQLSSRKMSYSQSLINYKLALLNLKIAALYDFENDMPVVPIRELEN